MLLTVRFLILILGLLLAGCVNPNDDEAYNNQQEKTTEIKSDTSQINDQTKTIAYVSQNNEIETGKTTPQELLAYAQTLIGTPYQYGSTDPAKGFDCSGFITYVFNHFNISVPRSSIDFTNIHTEINRDAAKPGDLILFTGTDSTIRSVGHMGIIFSVNNNDLSFIHSSSGKANSVTVTPLNTYYIGRFVKIIRIFKQNDLE